MGVLEQRKDQMCWTGCITDFLQHRFLFSLTFIRTKCPYYGSSVGRLCLNHFFSEEGKAVKCTPSGFWLDEGHSGVEGFTLALCDAGLAWRGNTDYCTAPDQFHLLEMTAGGQAFNSHFKWGPEIKKK